MRNMARALNVLKDHVSPVMDVAYAPSGREIATASWDRTVRIFTHGRGHSREAYYGRRMQRVAAVTYSPDNDYIYSGSEEGSVRVWKALANAKVGPMVPAEKRKRNYDAALVRRHAHLPEVRRIAKQRNLPRYIVNATKNRRIVSTAEKRREAQRRRHSAPGQVPFTAERDAAVQEEHE